MPTWTNLEAMVRLGASHPANDILRAGSWYWLRGGIIDGSGVADGVSIGVLVDGYDTTFSKMRIYRARRGRRATLVLCGIIPDMQPIPIDAANLSESLRRDAALGVARVRIQMS